MPAKPTSGERLLLLDSASGTSGRSSGSPTCAATRMVRQNNAIRGLLDMIAPPRHLRAGPPVSCACWDDDWRPAVPGRGRSRPTRRTASLRRWPGESRRRSPTRSRPQIPVIARRPRSARHRPASASDGYEADDVIGTFAAPAAAARRGHGHRPPRPVPAGRRREPGFGSSTPLAAASGTPTSSTRPRPARSTRSDGDAYADMRPCAGTRPRPSGACRAIGDKTAAPLLERYGALAGLRAAGDGGGPGHHGSPAAPSGGGVGLPGRRPARRPRRPRRAPAHGRLRPPDEGRRCAADEQGGVGVRRDPRCSPGAVRLRHRLGNRRVSGPRLSGQPLCSRPSRSARLAVRSVGWCSAGSRGGRLAVERVLGSRMA